MLMQATAPDHAQAQALRLQLRILTGAHEGACVAVSMEVTQGIHLANHGDGDIWLTDADLFDTGNAWLYADAQNWLLLPEPQSVTEAPSGMGDPLQGKGSLPLGQAMWLGEVCVLVCDAQEPWQDPARWPRHDGRQVEAASVEEADALHQPSGELGTDAVHKHDRDAGVAVLEPAEAAERLGDAIEGQLHNMPAEHHHTQARASTRMWRSWAALAACAVFMGFGAGAVWWVQSMEHPAALMASTAPISEEMQQQQMQEARMVIAMVDPGLRLQIDPLPQGGVRISGWLADQNKLDQLVQALASLRPLPQVALRTMADLNDVVQEVGHSHGMYLSLRPQSQSGVKVSGVLWAEDKRQAVLSDVQQRLPPGMQLEDGLYAPQAHVPVVMQWLKGFGLDVKEVAWKQETLQLHVRLRSGQRRTLEQALLRRGHPLQGIPFRLITVDQAGPASAARGRLPANSAGVPVAVRTVVGGQHPYLVTMNGQKLQPGAQVGAWHLVSIASDHVLWDGPQLLEVAR